MRGDTHNHGGGFDLPGGDPHGRGVNLTLLAEFVGAGFDGCTTCQDSNLTLLVEDAATCARAVELACMFIDQALGGLPSDLTDLDAPSPAGVEFRRLARLGPGPVMFAECEAMTAAQRRAAVNTAADLIVGCLNGGG